MTPDVSAAIEQLKQPQPPERRDRLIETVVGEGGGLGELYALASELDSTSELRAALAEVFSVQVDHLLFQMSCLAVRDDPGVQLAVADGFGALADSLGNIRATLGELAKSKNAPVRTAAIAAQEELARAFRGEAG